MSAFTPQDTIIDRNLKRISPPEIWSCFHKIFMADKQY